MNSNGTYTLKPIKNFIYTSYTTFPDDSGTKKILDCANLFVDDSSDINRNIVTNGKGRIYGEDESIYITVEPGTVDTSDPTGDAITNVNGVYTGAQAIKVELTPASKGDVNADKVETRVAQESTSEANAYVYSIYDNNGYIIASILMGKAQGGSANYVYVVDGAKNERVEHSSSTRSADTDTYYWEFDAIVDGAQKTLTVKEKYADTKAVLIQPEKGKIKVNDCGSVAEAVSRMKDRSDTNVPTGKDPNYNVTNGSGIGRAGTVELTDSMWNPFGGALQTNVKLTEVKPWVAGTQVVMGGEVWINNVNAGTFSQNINISDLGVIKIVALTNYGSTANITATTKVKVNSKTDVTITKVEAVAAPETVDVMIDDKDGSKKLSANDIITLKFSAPISGSVAHQTLTGTAFTLDAGTLADNKMSITYKVTVSPSMPPISRSTLTAAELLTCRTSR